MVYVVVQILCTATALIASWTGSYQEGEYSVGSLYVYVVFFNSGAQTWAMYCLVLFYHAFKEELQPLVPLPKFLAIKVRRVQGSFLLLCFLLFLLLCFLLFFFFLVCLFVCLTLVFKKKKKMKRMLFDLIWCCLFHFYLIFVGVFSSGLFSF